MPKRITESPASGLGRVRTADVGTHADLEHHSLLVIVLAIRWSCVVEGTLSFYKPSSCAALPCAMRSRSASLTGICCRNAFRLHHRPVRVINREHDPSNADLEQQVEESRWKIEPPKV